MFIAFECRVHLAPGVHEHFLHMLSTATDEGITLLKGWLNAACMPKLRATILCASFKLESNRFHFVALFIYDIYMAKAQYYCKM